MSLPLEDPAQPGRAATLSGSSFAFAVLIGNGYGPATGSKLSNLYFEKLYLPALRRLS
jgi:hypothetical protein